MKQQTAMALRETPKHLLRIAEKSLQGRKVVLLRSSNREGARDALQLEQVRDYSGENVRNGQMEPAPNA
jgi:hypothetical protein